MTSEPMKRRAVIASGVMTVRTRSTQMHATIGRISSQPSAAGQLAAGREVLNRSNPTPIRARRGRRMTCLLDGGGPSALFGCSEPVWDDGRGGSDCCEDDTHSSSHCIYAISHNGIAS